MFPAGLHVGIRYYAEAQLHEEIGNSRASIQANYREQEGTP